MERDTARALVAGAVDEYQRRAHLGQGRALHNPAEMIDRVLRAVSAGASDGTIWSQRYRGGLDEGGGVSFWTAPGVCGLWTTFERTREPPGGGRLLAETDRRLDISSPIVQARILGGAARLTAVMPPSPTSFGDDRQLYTCVGRLLPHWSNLGP